MVATTEKSSTLTLEEFLALPETKPAREYHPGRIDTKPMPKGKHSILQFEIAVAINQHSKPTKTAYALPELRCTFAGRSIVPDIAVLRWANLPRDEDGEISDQVTCPPDWIIEILPSDQVFTLAMEKILFCLNQGTELGWLIDPHTKGITIFNHSRPQIHLPGDTTPLKVLQGLEDWQITHQTLFDWLKV